jgi:hypothetical protein
MIMEKIDPYKHKERYLAWKDFVNGRIPNISEENSKIILNYLFDIKNGQLRAPKKFSLLNIKDKIVKWKLFP